MHVMDCLLHSNSHSELPEQAVMQVSSWFRHIWAQPLPASTSLNILTVANYCTFVQSKAYLRTKRVCQLIEAKHWKNSHCIQGSMHPNGEKFSKVETSANFHIKFKAKTVLSKIKFFFDYHIYFVLYQKFNSTGLYFCRSCCLQGGLQDTTWNSDRTVAFVQYNS